MHKTQSAEGYSGPPTTLYSHVPTISTPLVAPEPIPVGPSEYVNIQTNEESNLARLRGKKVMISSNPEIIPRQDSFADASSPEVSPLGKAEQQNFTFGVSEATVLASLNSAVGSGGNSRDLNSNSLADRNTPHAVAMGEGDFRGGFNSNPLRQGNSLQTFGSHSNYPPGDEISEDSDSSSAGMKMGSYGFRGETRNQPNQRSSPQMSSQSQRPSVPPPPPPQSPPPPPPAFCANEPHFPPPPEDFTSSNGIGHPVNPQDDDPREALYAKVDKTRRAGNSNRLIPEAPYASISEFDKLSITSGESERSSVTSPKRGIL